MVGHFKISVAHLPFKLCVFRLAFQMTEDLSSSLSLSSLLILLFSLLFLYLSYSLLSSLFCFSLFPSHSSLSLPPISPASILQNIVIKGYDRTHHFYQQSLWCHQHVMNTQKNTQKNTLSSFSFSQSLETGCVYRLRMPYPGGLIICCDYKLARILLGGNEEKSIPESEKQIYCRL